MLEVVMFGVGFVSGMYVCTQLEKSIDRNINTKNLKKNLERLDKKEKK
jgi:hypothetical protein